MGHTGGWVRNDVSPDAGCSCHTDGKLCDEGSAHTARLPKAGPGVAMALMLELPRRRGHVLAFAAGIALPIATVAWFFAARGALDPFIYYNVQLNVRLIADRFPPLPQLLANILHNPAVFLLGAGGLASSLARLRDRATGTSLLALTAVALVAGIFIIGRSYDQYYALLLPLLAVLGAGFVRDRVHTFAPAWIARPAYAAVAMLLLTAFSVGNQVRVYRSNDGQLADVEFVTAHTNASDAYVGGSPGPALFRPNAWFYFFLTGPFADDRAFADLQAAIEAGRPRLVLMDETFRASPPAILAAVRRRYAPVRGIIWDRRATDSTRDPSRSNTTRQ